MDKPPAFDSSISDVCASDWPIHFRPVYVQSGPARGQPIHPEPRATTIDCASGTDMPPTRYVGGVWIGTIARPDVSPWCTPICVVE